MQPLPNLKNTVFGEKISRLNWTRFIGRRIVSVGFKTDTDKLNLVVYRCRKNLKDREFALKLTEYQTILAKWLCLLSYLDMISKQCILLDKTTVHIWNSFQQIWIIFFYIAFPDTTRDRNVTWWQKYWQKLIAKCMSLLGWQTFSTWGGRKKFAGVFDYGDAYLDSFFSLEIV